MRLVKVYGHSDMHQQFQHKRLTCSLCLSVVSKQRWVYLGWGNMGGFPGVLIRQHFHSSTINSLQAGVFDMQ